MSRKGTRRRENRKFKRLEIRYGSHKPEHRGIAIQLSTNGAFLSVSRPIYAVGSRIVLELKTSKDAIILSALVRHCKNVPPQLASFSRTGMGIEFISPPPELKEFLASL